MDPNPNDNPYAAPTPLESVEPPPPTLPRSLRPPYMLWLSVVLINLPLPVFFGIASSQGFGRFGMPVGIGLVTAVGWLLCRQFPDFMRKLSIGSVLTALSQFYPMLHIFVGAWAVALCGGAGGGGRDLDGIFQVTAATILTGIGLILPSIAAGYLMSYIGWLFKGRPR